MNKYLARKLAVACVVVSTSAFGQQRGFCDAILQYGIFDQYRVLDERSRYELTMSAYCRSSARSRADSLGGSIEQVISGNLTSSTQEVDQFCSSSFAEVRANHRYSSAVSKVSEVIANSWIRCIRENRGGVSHFISPTSDPARFTYKISFEPDGAPDSVVLDEWTMTGHTNCEGMPLAKGVSVNSGGREIQCSRNPASTVVVTVNTVGSTGTKNLRPITLAGYREGDSTGTPPLAPDPYYLVDNHKSSFLQSSGAHGGLVWGGVFWQTEVWISGVRYHRAVGMVPPNNGIARAEFVIPAGARYFRSIFGLAREDKNPNSYGHAGGKVFIDGIQVWQGNLSPQKRVTQLVIGVPAGARQLLLETDSQGSHWGDNTTWGDPYFSANP